MKTSKKEMQSVMLRELLKDNMEEQEEQEQKGEFIFGRFIGHKELFWNGIAFLLIGAAYDAISVGAQLPESWKDNVEDTLKNIDGGWVIQTFLFIISYLLLDKRFFGTNLMNVIKKYGYQGYFLRKIALITGLLFITLTLKIITLITFF